MTILVRCSRRSVLLCRLLLLLALVVVILSGKTTARTDLENDRRDDEENQYRTCSLSMGEAGECPYSYHAVHVTDDDGETKTNETGTSVKRKNNETSIHIKTNETDTGVKRKNNETSIHIPINTTTVVDTSRLRGASMSRQGADDPQLVVIKSHWGEDQTVSINIDDDDDDDSGVIFFKVRRLIEETDLYMHHTVFKQNMYHKVRRHCKNRHGQCSQWAVLGECHSNPEFMHLQCAPACQTCEMLDIAIRCPVGENTKDAWLPGDLNRMFERIMDDPFFQEEYGPLAVLSMPHAPRSGRLGHNPNHSSGSSRMPDGPWLLSLDNFLSEEECERLIQLGDMEGYEPSYEVGQAKFDGTRAKLVSSGRTSYNAWCLDKCSSDPVTQKVLDKLGNLTGIPQDNIENLQLLRYETGQHYEDHFDYSYHERERPQGVRILTVFLYLNDVEEGGETEFSGLKSPMTITPKQGKALIWANVLNQDPNSLDRRTRHQALPVKKGVKYSTNVWFHQRDFKTPHANGCSA